MSTSENQKTKNKTKNKTKIEKWKVRQQNLINIGLPAMPMRLGKRLPKNISQTSTTQTAARYDCVHQRGKLSLAMTRSFGGRGGGDGGAEGGKHQENIFVPFS